MAINIDNMLDVKKKFVIAGKEVEITFNDETNDELNAIDVDLTKLIESIVEATETSEMDVATAEEQKRYIKEQQQKMRIIVSKFFDKAIEKGEGERIYNYYSKSTSALAAVVGIIRKYSDITREERKKNYPKKYSKRR